MPRAIRGVLVQCDPSIKSIIFKINDEYEGEYIVEDLDDSTFVVKENAVAELKAKLEVRLKETHQQDDGDGSD